MFIIIHSTQSCYKHPYIRMYCMFQPIMAIIKYIELLQSPLLLSAVLPYTGQGLYVGSVLYINSTSPTQPFM
jgi:hypothetical protein